MKEFDYIIIGGGCAGLSLAYELDINNKLNHKTLAIIEPRKDYKRDKTWSFWKVFDHNFEDCVIKSWNNFTINTSENSHELRTKNIENYNKAGKIYINNITKIYQTILSIFDLIMLFLIKQKSDYMSNEHFLISEKIDLNERI